MKKSFTLIALAVLFLTAVANVSAQNRCFLNNGHGSIGSITYSDQMMLLHQDEQSVSLISKTEVKPQQRGDAATHTLNVYFPEESDSRVYVSDGVNVLAQMYNWESDYLSVELEEGTYYLLSVGSDFATDRHCVWVMDDLELDADKDVQIDFGQCEYNLFTDVVDVEGRHFKDMETKTALYLVNFYWLDGVQVYDTWSYSMNGYGEQVPNRWYSSYGDKSALELKVTIEPGDQTSYFVTFPKVYGLSDHLTLANAVDDYSVVEEMFHVNEGVGPCYYDLTGKHFCRLLNGGIITNQVEFVCDDFFFDPARPYTIVSNLKIGDPTAYESGTDILVPAVYESLDWEIGLAAYHDCYRTPFYIDTEGNVVREALPYYETEFNMVSIPNFFPETPALTIKPASKTAYFGERTPLSCYNPIAFNSETFPLGLTAFLGAFYSSGEESCERVCDYDQLITVNIGGQEVYSDSLYLFNKDANTFMPDPAPVFVEVANRHLGANEVSKSNYTRVDFNLANDDAIPPTMTFLRVLNDKGDEAIQLPDLARSSLVFGCADFTCTFDMDYFYFVPGYQARPNVEVYYSVGAGEWLPLDAVEDENLFHMNHGNVFVADLSQLAGQVADTWVSCKFVLTDEAGNSQAQELDNLFFAGAFESVDELVGLGHVVAPNPFNSAFRVTVAEAVNGTAHVMVYNVLGELIYSRTENCADTREFTIDGSALKPGVYFYGIDTEQGLLQGKIVKE